MEGFSEYKQWKPLNVIPDNNVWFTDMIKLTRTLLIKHIIQIMNIVIALLLLVLVCSFKKVII